MPSSFPRIPTPFSPGTAKELSPAPALVAMAPRPPMISLRSVLHPFARLYPDSAPPSSRKTQGWVKNRSPHSGTAWASIQSTCLSTGCCVQSTGDSRWLQRPEGSRGCGKTCPGGTPYFGGPVWVRGKVYLCTRWGNTTAKGGLKLWDTIPPHPPPHPISKSGFLRPWLSTFGGYVQSDKILPASSCASSPAWLKNHYYTETSRASFVKSGQWYILFWL